MKGYDQEEREQHEQEKAELLEYMRKREAEELKRMGVKREKSRGSAHPVAKDARAKKKAKRKAARQSRKGR